MEVYEITYDYFSEDGYTDERNIRERFEGNWFELQEYIKIMKNNGCYNIYAAYLYDYEDALY